MYSFCRSIGLSDQCIQTIISILLDQELWDIYDQDRTIVAHSRLKSFALGDNEYHLVVNVWVRYRDGFIITKRVPWKYQGLKWECVEGSVIAGETPEEAAKRECHEELGVSINDMKLLDIETVNHKHVFTYVAELRQNLDDIVIRCSEICNLRTASKSDIIQMINNQEFMADIAKRWDRYSKKL